MSLTMDVSCVVVNEDIFKRLCDKRYTELVKEIQGEYHNLENEIAGRITPWMKIKDEDFYLETNRKMLFPQTSKMSLTYLDFACRDSYFGVIKYVEGLGEKEAESVRKKAEGRKQILPSGFEKKIGGLDAEALSKELAEELFDSRQDNPNICPGKGFQVKGTDAFCKYILVGNDPLPVYDILGNAKLSCRNSVNAVLKVSVHLFEGNLPVLDIFVKYGLYPEAFDEKIIGKMKAFHEIAQNDIDIRNLDDLNGYFRRENIPAFLDKDFRMEVIEKEVLNTRIDLAGAGGGIIRHYLDNCDYIRARIQKYQSAWYLSDEGMGHWELWEKPAERAEVQGEGDVGKGKLEEKAAPGDRVLLLRHGAVARNPVSDVKHDAVIGIDFGTKSTVVVLQNGDGQIVPLRVGMADYSVVPEAAHYENPTVMQFVDLTCFMRQYRLAPNRPRTSWSDLMVSHEACKNLIGAEESRDMASFVTDIKQWAAGRYGGNLIIRDTKGVRYDIAEYMELTEEDIDLVEWYAYYIGLFINNMHMGVYLDYMLSFPETFPLRVKSRILDSFTKGIRKSIPAPVLEDPECKAEFRVRQGPGEPAAYAACALGQYGIEPTDAGVFYGIFDFGGGTADFDYGIWKNAPADEYTYNYILSHYGAGGDGTLGGENILQLVAYEVFSDDSKRDGKESNLDIMRNNKLVFYRPPEGKIYSGMEALNNDGERALLNTKQMMEALRPIWEEWPEVMEWAKGNIGVEKLEVAAFQNVTVTFEAPSTIKAGLLLFSETGRVNVELTVDMDMVNRLICGRIESGVSNFFEGLRHAYERWETKTNEKIHLFLAGNASKSERVTRLFDKYAVLYDKAMFGGVAGAPEKDPTNQVAVSSFFDEGPGLLDEEGGAPATRFIVYPPLGTDAARNIQRERGIVSGKGNLMEPTGKTGVAFGLVLCREGSMIRVESETGINEQIKLNYYIGINYRKNFKMIFDRAVEYNKWLKFSRVAAGTETFEFYYSELPEVVNGNVQIMGNSLIHKRKCLLGNVGCGANIYFRFINPTQLEYVTALEDKVEANEYMGKIYTVKL